MTTLVQSLLLLLAFRQGACDFGSNSLIQRSKERVGGTSQGEQNEGETNSHVALANAHSFITDLAKKVAGHDYTMTADENSALTIIRKFLVDLRSSMTTQFAEDQKLVDLKRDMIQTCADDTVNRYNTAVSGLHTAVLGSEASHAQCRAKEVAKLNIKNNLCSIYNNHRRSSAGIPPVCLNTLTVSDVTAGVGTKKKTDMESCLVASKAWMDPLYSKYTACKDATKVHDDVRADECNPAQTQFEREFCTYDLKLDDSCSEQDTCRTNAIQARNTTHASIEIEEAARKGDWKTAKKIECFFDIFDETDNTKKPGMLTSCEALTTDVSDITIDYHDIPAAASCIEEPNQPCDEVWKTARYKNKPWSAQAPATACIACTTRLVR